MIPRGRSNDDAGSKHRRSDHSPYPGHRSVPSSDDSKLENELAGLSAGRSARRETRWEQTYINEDIKLVQRGYGESGVVRLSSVTSDSDSDTSALSYANSALSTASLASSATDLSKHSGYSTLAIAEATKELINILRDHEEFALLYKRAITDVNIGSAKLEKNLKEYFKNYARHLMKEASDSLEALASQLVLLKARHVARSIIEKYGPEQVVPQRSQKPWMHEDSSDEETEKSSIDHSEFGDLALFRQFLVGNESFTLLRGQIRSFVLPKSARQENVQAAPDKVESSDAQTMAAVEDATAKANKPPSSAFSQHPFESGKQMIETVLVAMGYKESPLKAGFTRLRWRCVSASQVLDKRIGIAKLTKRAEMW